MYREAFERLPDYLRKSNNESLYYIGYGGMNELRDTFYDIQDSRNIDKAFGQTLDFLGGNVGQERQGMDDDLYRVMIKVKIIANLSKGDIPTINEVAEAVLGDDFEGVTETWSDSLYKNEPAGLVIHIRPRDLNLAVPVAKAIAGGVGVSWIIDVISDDATVGVKSTTMAAEIITVYPREEVEVKDLKQGYKTHTSAYGLITVYPYTPPIELDGEITYSDKREQRIKEIKLKGEDIE